MLSIKSNYEGETSENPDFECKPFGCLGRKTNMDFFKDRLQHVGPNCLVCERLWRRFNLSFLEKVHLKHEPVSLSGSSAEAFSPAICKKVVFCASELKVAEISY